jgi:hypothetical protein
MAGFWRWFDRGSRMDFGGTVLAFLWDWKTWAAALVPGGVVTFLWAAIKDRDPLDVWLMAIIATAGWIIIIAGVSAVISRIRRGIVDLEIVYDQTDGRFVRPQNDHIRYYVGLRILCHRSVDFPNIRALEGPFANEVLAVAHNGQPYGNVEIYKGGTLDWDDLEIVELVGLPNRAALPPEPENILNQSHRFTLEARGRDVRVARAEFEYDPQATPMIRMLS